MNSRAKGKRGELELAAWFRDHGISARRGQQFSGSPDSPDVVISLPGFHVESKRTEELSLYKAMEQAAKDAGPREIPVVFHRRNRKPWLVIMDAEDFLGIVR